MRHALFSSLLHFFPRLNMAVYHICSRGKYIENENQDSLVKKYSMIREVFSACTMVLDIYHF